MRAPIAYYMMLLYFTVMFKPFIPIVKDVISHTFAEAIHIATVHAIYGSNHLQKEIAESDAGNACNKHQNSTNAEDQTQMHILAIECAYNFGSFLQNKNHLSSKPYQIKNGFIVKHSPPPRFS